MKKTFQPYKFLVLILLQLFSLLCFSQGSTTTGTELSDTAAINKAIKQIAELIKGEDNGEGAMELSLKVVEASKKLNYEQGMLSGNHSLGYMLSKVGQLDSAKKAFKKCIKLIEKNKDLNYSITLFISLANIYGRQSDYDSAVIFDGYVRKHSLVKGDTLNFIRASNNIAVSFRYLGMWDSSLAVLKQNEEVIRIRKDTVRLANCILLQGTILQGQGNVKPALECYFKALEVISQIKEHPLIYLTQQSIATLYLEMEEYRKAVELLRSIKNEYEAKVQGKMTLYNTLGKAYQGLNSFDSALYYYRKSVDECLTRNQPGQAAIAYRFLGELLNQHGRYDEALDYLQKGIKVCDRKKMKQEYALTCNSLGTSLLNLHKLNKAETYFTEAMSIGSELNDISILKDAANGLRHVNAKKRKFEIAYYYLEQYKQYSDSLLNAKNIRAIATRNLEYEYNNEKASFIQQQEEERLLHQESLKRQKLIRNTIIVLFLILSLVSVIIYRSYKAKKKANDEKAALMKEIHHRVKNNLQIISSLLSIQTESVTDAGVIDAVKESQSRVKAMALIHQLLYQNNDLSRIDFNIYLPQLTHVLSSIFRREGQKIKVTVDAKDIAFDIDMAVPLGLIITELVSNAFKYAFRDAPMGNIGIRIQPLGEKKFRLTVSDNGKGLPPDIDFDQLDSMGLRLVKLLTNQLAGNFNYQYNKGAVFNVEFTIRP